MIFVSTLKSYSLSHIYYIIIVFFANYIHYISTAELDVRC